MTPVGSKGAVKFGGIEFVRSVPLVSACSVQAIGQLDLHRALPSWNAFTNTGHIHSESREDLADSIKLRKSNEKIIKWRFKNISPGMVLTVSNCTESINFHKF